MRISIICAAGGLYYVTGKVKLIRFILKRLGWEYDKKRRLWFTTDVQKKDAVRRLSQDRYQIDRLLDEIGEPRIVDLGAAPVDDEGDDGEEVSNSLLRLQQYYWRGSVRANLSRPCTEKVEYFDLIYYVAGKSEQTWELVSATADHKFLAEARFCRVLETYDPQNHPTLNYLIKLEAGDFLEQPV